MLFNIFMISCLVVFGILLTFLVVNLEQKREVKTMAETDIEKFEMMHNKLTAWKDGKYSAFITTKNNRG